MPPLGRGARFVLLVVLVLVANEGLRLFLRLDVLERLYALGLAVLLWAFINGRFLFAYYHALRATWLTRRLPEARPYTDEDRLLVLAPHPDDETLAAAGQVLAAKEAGAAVKVVWLTLGDGFELAAPRPGPEGLRELAKIRMEEAKKATQILGLGDEDRIFLGYPDQGLLRLFLTHYYLPFESPHTKLRRVSYPGCFREGAPYTGKDLEADLKAVLDAFRPTRVLVPSPLDAHPDHQAAAYFAMRILAERGETDRLRYYIVHGGYEYPLPKGLHPRLPLYPAPRGRHLPWEKRLLREEHIEKKLAAVRAHASQLGRIGRFMLAFVRTNELESPLPVPARLLPSEVEGPY